MNRLLICSQPASCLSIPGPGAWTGGVGIRVLSWLAPHGLSSVGPEEEVGGGGRRNGRGRSQEKVREDDGEMKDRTVRKGTTERR